MRKIIIAAGIGLIVSMTAVAAPDEQSPEAKAYFSMSFGGAKSAPQKLHYGLRLDHDRFFAPSDQPLAPLMQLDFTRRGVNALSVNGRNVLRSAYRVNQSEDEEFEEEDEGFFEGIGNWFANLFGDDEEEDEDAEGEEQAAAAEDADEPAEDAEPSEGYDVVDWGLLAIGLAGVGYVTAELVDGEDDGRMQPATGGSSGTPSCGLPGPLPPGCDIPVVPVAFTATAGNAAGRVEHQQWLDDGTGQMGDLYVRD